MKHPLFNNSLAISTDFLTQITANENKNIRTILKLNRQHLIQPFVIFSKAFNNSELSRPLFVLDIKHTSQKNSNIRPSTIVIPDYPDKPGHPAESI